MNIIKHGVLITVITFLAGCGGHEYEGDYEVMPTGFGKLTQAFVNEMVNDKSIKQNVITIGSDYIEDTRSTTEFEKIYTMTKRGKDYLVFESENKTQHMEIIDEDTLKMKTALGYTTLKRI